MPINKLYIYKLNCQFSTLMCPNFLRIIVYAVQLCCVVLCLCQCRVHAS